MQTITSQPGMQSNVFQKVAPQMNSQGEVIPEPIQQGQQEPQQKQLEPQQQEQPKQQSQLQECSYEEFIELGDTELAPAADALMPATDDTNLEHKIISCGHVLKSTHDLARWSEKTGARRVNTQESIDAVSDLAINLEPNRGAGGNRRRGANNNNSDPAADIQGLFNEGRKGGAGGRRRQQQRQWQPVEGGSEVIQCWPVLKSTHDQAQLSEKRGKNAVNQAGASDALEELALNQQQGNQQGGQQQRGQQQAAEPASLEGVKQMFGGPQEFNTSASGEQQSGGSQILHAWPVLKSTHDLARISEKRGPNSVNQAGTSEILEEIAQNEGQQQQGGIQAGGSSLQSGMDTQAGSHIQMDNQQSLKETPEKFEQELHIHV